MRFRHTLLLILILLFSAFLTACEEDDSDEGTITPQSPAEIAEVVLDALNKGDTATARQYLCEKDISILAENPPGEAYPEYGGVSCAGNESIVTCSYNIEIDGLSKVRDLEAVFDVIEDGQKLCSVEDE